ncbi:MAG: hypothetical protein EKK39_11310 [Sphingobacteriales bacterium]|uniref:hypothetical protein n=1 Tax=Hydrotalea flava TaxID=714549 RepID=UPI000FB5F840|nr:hypothetical protein [Hydrotalea flava]RTL49321.1 MAG: hypothetical protein EKK39_11310 [Sphingobacteriales bacterium]
MQQLIAKYPCIQQLLTKSKALHDTLFRQVELQCYSNEEKFKALMERNAHLLNYAPHKYLASYLGMDATNFSKILNGYKI